MLTTSFGPLDESSWSSDDLCSLFPEPRHLIVPRRRITRPRLHGEVRQQMLPTKAELWAHSQRSMPAVASAKEGPILANDPGFAWHANVSGVQLQISGCGGRRAECTVLVLAQISFGSRCSAARLATPSAADASPAQLARAPSVTCGAPTPMPGRRTRRAHPATRSPDRLSRRVPGRA